MKKTLLVVFSIGIMLASCKKEENYICYSIEQTQCADPWGYGNSDMATINLLRTYLAQNGVNADKVSLKTTGTGMNCLACTCTTGRTFFITAPDNNKADLETLGFAQGECE